MHFCCVGTTNVFKTNNTGTFWLKKRVLFNAINKRCFDGQLRKLFIEILFLSSYHILFRLNQALRSGSESNLPDVQAGRRVQLVVSMLVIIITKTRLYNTDPLKPHFYIVKQGLTGVYIIFFTSAQKHKLWVLIRTASVRWF